MHGLEAEYDQKMKFTYLDIDDPANDAFKQELGYRVQPHIFLLDEEGNVLQEWLGMVSEEQFRQAFDNALK